MVLVKFWVGFKKPPVLEQLHLELVAILLLKQTFLLDRLNQLFRALVQLAVLEKEVDASLCLLEFLLERRSLLVVLLEDDRRARLDSQTLLVAFVVENAVEKLNAVRNRQSRFNIVAARRNPQVIHKLLNIHVCIRSDFFDLFQTRVCFGSSA